MAAYVGYAAHRHGRGRRRAGPGRPGRGHHRRADLHRRRLRRLPQAHQGRRQRQHRPEPRRPGDLARHQGQRPRTTSASRSSTPTRWSSSGFQAGVMPVVPGQADRQAGPGARPVPARQLAARPAARSSASSSWLDAATRPGQSSSSQARPRRPPPRPAAARRPSPRVEPALEEGVDAAGGQPGQVERRGAGAADVAHAREQLADHVGLRGAALRLVGEAGGHQRLLERPRVAHVQRGARPGRRPRRGRRGTSRRGSASAPRPRPGPSASSSATLTAQAGKP